MKKAYVLDTNILIHCPDAIYKFEDNDIYICPQVIDELDKHKNDHGEAGYNTREALRHIKDLMNGYDDLNAIPIRDKGNLFLDYKVKKHTKPALVTPILDDSIPDNRIINFAYTLAMTLPERTILVTNDTGMMIKARRCGVETQEFRSDRIADVSNIYTGRGRAEISDNQINEFFKEHCLLTEDVFTENQYIHVVGQSGATGLAKYKNGILCWLEHLTDRPFDVTPRNEGQRFLTNACMTSQTEIPLVLVNGPAGTGKTLIALACGLEQVTERHTYKRVLLCRPNAIMDNDLGFLPGTEEEKISPLLRGAYDNLEIMLGHKNDTKEELDDKIQEIFQRGYIKTEAVGYLRGRSITNTFIIIDEAQNTTPTQILSIITRAGEGSKIVLLGDINQIDLPRLDKGNNGLTYAIEKMKGSSLCDIITFSENECTRSALAKEASDLLKM